MKLTKKTLFFAFVIIVVGIIIYLFFRLKKTVSPQPIITFQFYQLVITALSSLLTLCAVIVALFKEQIIRIFHYPKIEITPKDEKFLHEHFQKNAEKEATTESTTTTLQVAEKYETILKIHNTGNISAEDCQIQLKSIVFSDPYAAKDKTIDIKSTPLNWGFDTTTTKNTILPNHSDFISILTISADTKSSPGNAQSTVPIFKVGEIEISRDKYQKGIWTATFLLLCKNCDIIEYKLEIKWNGEWENRLTDMTNNIEIKVSNDKVKKK